MDRVRIHLKLKVFENRNFIYIHRYLFEFFLADLDSIRLAQHDHCMINLMKKEL